MENIDLNKIRNYLQELGMTEEEIKKQLANPLYAEVYMSQISAYEKAYHATDPNETYSTPFDSFANNDNNPPSRKGK